MQRLRIAVLVFVALVLANDGMPAKSPLRLAQAVPPEANLPTEQNECLPGSPKPGKSGKDLSDQLAQSKGVICPPDDVDPRVASPPPAGGGMPIIRPPGTPGGSQDVQPK